MENNANDSGGRVTRSLRKRLTSVDSESSNRPDTPIASTLSSISEISASPRTTRITRRNSVSGLATPVKTPIKRGVGASTILENSESTPVRRSTRRRSISANDFEENSGLKSTPFPTLDEENDQSYNKTNKITRSQSKSPQEIKTLKKSPSPKKSTSPNQSKCKNIKVEVLNISSSKKRKPGPKSKTRDLEESDVTDTEDIVLGNENKNNTSNNTISFTDNDLNQIASNYVENDKNTPTEKLTAQNDRPGKGEKSTVSSQLKVIDVIQDDNLNISTHNKHDCVKNHEIVNDKIDTMNEDGIGINSPITDVLDLNVNDFVTSESTEITLLSSDKEETLNASNLTPCFGNTGDKNICRNSLKKVEFLGSPNESIKKVYPKTPTSANKFVEIDESENEDLLNINHSPKNVKPIKEVPELPTCEENITPKCDLKSLQTVQCSTSVNIDTLQTVSKTLNELATNETPLNELETNETPLNKLDLNLHENVLESNETPRNKKILENNDDNSSNNKDVELKWINPKVIMTTTNDSKLDVLVSTQHNTNSSDKQVAKHKNLSSEDEDKYEEQELEANELISKEESYERKHDYIDDEAMEVNNYESGDSMDSEERKEMKENEVPIDAISIGSSTTEEEDGEDHCSIDSFIVSDSERLVCYDSEKENKNKNVNKKIYKRIVNVDDSGSTSNEEEVEVDNEKCITTLEELKSHDKIILVSKPAEEELIAENKSESATVPAETNSTEYISETNNLFSNSSENSNIDASKLSDSPVQLVCSDESEYEEENNLNKIKNTSACSINKPKSYELDKIIHDADQEIDASNKESREKQSITEEDSKIIKENNASISFFEEHRSIMSTEESVNKSHSSDRKLSESHLEEISQTNEGDGNKENENKSINLSQCCKTDSELSAVTLQNSKKAKEKQESQKSFSVDVTMKDIDSETFSSPNEHEKFEQLEEIEHENEHEDKTKQKNKNILLSIGNPLIRTRRQSLALPTNPDMEICLSTHKKINRKTLDVLPDIEFNPSQSFIDSIELQKSKHSRLLAKRKRLSKSFCGAAESHEKSIVDVDVQHLPKKCKFMDDNHHDDNINSSENFTKISSTHEKIKKEDDKQRILRRCDEILEAANLAKFNNKIQYKKNKGKKSKKQSKKKTILTTTLAQGINRKEKTKTALSQAIKAAGAILNKKQKIHSNLKEQKEANRLELDVLDAIGGSNIVKKNFKKENIYNEVKTSNEDTSSTSAGIVMEFPQTPEKKRKTPTYIKLPTGKVIVEPITPEKRIIKTLNGMKFKESPVTPSATGFKVRQISTESDDILQFTSIKREEKQNRKEVCKSKKIKWTKSGFFKEENISKDKELVHHETPQLSARYNKTKNRLLEREADNANLNFKEKAMMRPGIERSSKHEILILKQRRQFAGH